MNVDRRTVLHAGALAAVSGLAVACGAPTQPSGPDGSGSNTGTPSAPVATDVETAGASAEPTSAAPDGALTQVADVPVGGGLIIADPAVVITQPAAGEIHCFSAICTHQGCLVGGVAEGLIVCPCHGSAFSATDGTVVQGPATMPLPKKKVTVTDGLVVLG